MRGEMSGAKTAPDASRGKILGELSWIGMDMAGAEAAVAADFIGHSLSPPVLFTKTVLRAAARTAVVRVRGGAGESFLACAKGNVLEVFRDTGDALELLFEEYVLGSLVALEPFERPMLLPQQQTEWDGDLLLGASDAGTLSVLQIDATSRRLRCIEQVCLPPAATFAHLWAGPPAGTERHTYGRRMCVSASGPAETDVSLCSP